jgi:hypothetical protein
VLGGQQIRGLLLKLLVNMPQLFKAAIVDGFEKAALLDTIRRCNVITGEVILFKSLDQMSPRGMFLEVKVFEL